MRQVDPLVSIVIPVYNGSNYLHEAIDSAIGQTYKNVEIIVVNDGSTDGGKTEDIAKSYGDRIRYLKKSNGGVSSALNLGIRKMRGQFFIWLSHDDYLSKNRISSDLELITKKHAKITFSKVIQVNQEKKVLNIRTSDYPKEIKGPKQILDNSGVSFCSMTIEKSCLDKIGKFDLSNKTTQDVQYCLDLSREYIFYKNNRGILYSRLHPNRGTIKLQKQHEKDLKYLGKYIFNHYRLRDFFPYIDLTGKPFDFAEAQSWMGNMFLNFRCHHIANHYFFRSFKTQPLKIKYFLKFLFRAELLQYLYRITSL